MYSHGSREPTPTLLNHINFEQALPLVDVTDHAIHQSCRCTVVLRLCISEVMDMERSYSDR